MTDGAITIDAAAVDLDISPSQLRSWIAAGAPVACRGRKGRGNRTLVDVSAVRAWHRARQPAAQDADARVADVLRVLQARLPELLANAVHGAFVQTPVKRDPTALAWLACVAWQLALIDVQHEIEELGGGCAANAPLPGAIDYLRTVANKSRSFEHFPQDRSNDPTQLLRVDRP